MKFLLLVLSLILSLSANATSLNFNENGNEKANKILKETIQKKIPEFNNKTISYFYDIDLDDNFEIIGIAKDRLFYSLKGYKLLILKNYEKENWNFIKNDIYFDNSLNFEINNDEITYYESIYNKTKKKKAKINHKIEEILINNKTNKKLIEPNEGFTHNDFTLEDFDVVEQKKINIKYNNLDTKTKHYLNIE